MHLCSEGLVNTTVPAPDVISISPPVSHRPAAFASSTTGTMATLILGMALGGAIVFAFVVVLTCAALRRKRRLFHQSQLAAEPETTPNTIEAQLPYGGFVSCTNARRASAVLAPESIREQMLARL